MATHFPSCGWAVAFLILVQAAQGAPAGGAGGFQFTGDDSGSAVRLTYRGRPILAYASGTNQIKPYLRELYSLTGRNILLDAPPDHLHHHGLMYAVRVNDVNYWEERDAPGYQLPVRALPQKIGRSQTGLPEASFGQVIHWVAKPGTAPVLVEERTLTVTVDEPLGEVALAWRASFELGSAANKVTLSGASYHGLGLRLPPEFNRVARHQNSENAPYLTQGTGDVTRARWSAVTHTLDGQQIMVALFGRPSPTRGLPLFFTMVEPFTYLSVTQGLDQQPLVYSAGETFELHYLLAVYSDFKPPEFLNKRF